MFSHQMETEAVKQCHSCSAPLPASDNFCRTCGIDQRLGPATATSMPLWSENKTKVVSNPSEARQASQTSGSLSSLLVSSLTKSVAVKTMPFRFSRLGVRVVAGLVVIPIWLLIIFLSPLEAYTAAKAASSQLSYE